MKKDRKVVLVGTGAVGMSAAYSFLTTGGIHELVLIDINQDKAEGEAMDLQHGLPYAPHNMIIRAGDYSDCADAEMVLITAGVPQKQGGQTRLELVEVNTRVVKSITEQAMAAGFDGVFVISSNPVDIMAYVVQKVSGLPASRIIGSGTILDTARLHFFIGQYLGVAPKNIHASILGEHGDSSLVSWKNAYVGSKNIIELFEETGRDLADLDEIYHKVQRVAYEIIERKRYTDYGIGLSLNRLVRAILNDERAILTVSSYQDGQYGHKGFYIGVPSVVTRQGIAEIIKLKLDEADQAKFDASCETLTKIIKEIVDPILAEK